MTLKQFLENLKTENVLVSISNKDNNIICKLYAEGYSSLEDALEERNVLSWEITGATALSVTVDDDSDGSNTDPNP